LVIAGSGDWRTARATVYLVAIQTVAGAGIFPPLDGGLR